MYKSRIVGNGWTKELKPDQPGGKAKKYVSWSFKEDIKKDTPYFQWPNTNKREGKRDPDWTMSVLNGEGNG